MTTYYIAEALPDSYISEWQEINAKTLRGAKCAAERGRGFQGTWAYVGIDTPRGIEELTVRHGGRWHDKSCLARWERENT